MSNLNGKVAWVTGAGSGIGLAGAKALAEAGATVVMRGRRKEILEPEAEKLRILGFNADIEPFDVADQAAVAAENALSWLDLDSGELAPWVTLEPAQPGIRLNDGRPDPVGRFWIGGMYDPTSAGRFDAFLHRVEADGSFVTVRRNVGCANGLAFSPDGKTMYWADTLHETVWAYDYDPTTGEQRNERVFLDFGPLPGRPDGACVDEAGCYWIACVGGSAMLRVTPDGRVDRTVGLPVKRPTMPAFGGPGLGTMYITTIGERDPGQDGPGITGLHGLNTESFIQRESVFHLPFVVWDVAGRLVVGHGRLAASGLEPDHLDRGYLRHTDRGR